MEEVAMVGVHGMGLHITVGGEDTTIITMEDIMQVIITTVTTTTVIITVNADLIQVTQGMGLEVQEVILVVGLVVEPLTPVQKH